MRRFRGDEMRWLAPVWVSFSGCVMPYVTATAVAFSCWALFMSKMLSPTTIVSCGLALSFFRAVSKCTGLGFTSGTESRVTTASKKSLRRKVSRM